jgi:hypothetical protein
MVLGGDHGEYVCEVSGSAINSFHRADAQLIISAPELLNALRDMLAQFDAGYFVRNTDGDGCSDWAIKVLEPVRALAAAKAAIAKAEGRS